MIWFGKSFIKFFKSFINLIKLVSTRTCSSARVRPTGTDPQNAGRQRRYRRRVERMRRSVVPPSSDTGGTAALEVARRNLSGTMSVHCISSALRMGRYASTYAKPSQMRRQQKAPIIESNVRELLRLAPTASPCCFLRNASRANRLHPSTSSASRASSDILQPSRFSCTDSSSKPCGCNPHVFLESNHMLAIVSSKQFIGS